MIITLAILLIITTMNKVDVLQPVQNNVENLIGCEDYTYKFTLNVPAVVTFTVTKGNGIDPEGFFKVINAEGKYSTILHCGNNYHVVYSAEGYKNYEEDLIVKGFKPIWEENKLITLQKL